MKRSSSAWQQQQQQVQSAVTRASHEQAMTILQAATPPTKLTHCPQRFGVQRARNMPLGNNGGQITHEAIEQRVASTTTTSSRRRDTRKS
jgi:hypothetical protein